MSPIASREISAGLGRVCDELDMSRDRGESKTSFSFAVIFVEYREEQRGISKTSKLSMDEVRRVSSSYGLGMRLSLGAEDHIGFICISA